MAIIIVQFTKSKPNNASVTVYKSSRQANNDLANMIYKTDDGKNDWTVNGKKMEMEQAFHTADRHDLDSESFHAVNGKQEILACSTID